MTCTSPTAAALADKLAAEGERIAEFFAAHADRQSTSIYADGATWSLRQTLEHLILSERSLLVVFRDVAAGGPGAPSDTDIEAFNRAHTDELAALSYAELGAAFRAQRAVTVACVRELTDEQLTLRGRHPAMGDSTLGDMFKMIAMHGVMHQRDVRRALT